MNASYYKNPDSFYSYFSSECNGSRKILWHMGTMIFSCQIYVILKTKIMMQGCVNSVINTLPVMWTWVYVITEYRLVTIYSLFLPLCTGLQKVALDLQAYIHINLYHIKNCSNWFPPVYSLYPSHVLQPVMLPLMHWQHHNPKQAEL